VLAYTAAIDRRAVVDSQAGRRGREVFPIVCLLRSLPGGKFGFGLWVKVRGIRSI